MAGPLGEIFDHGGVILSLISFPCLFTWCYRLRCAQHHGGRPCHSDPLLSYPYWLQQLEVLLASNALGLGRSWWTVGSQIATLANFYLTTWEEYHTGMLLVNPRSFNFTVRVRPAVPRILLRAGWRNYYGYYGLYYLWLLRFAARSFRHD